jgi:hypothetical protein
VRRVPTLRRLAAVTIVVLGAGAAAEAAFRLARFGPTRAALGRWQPPAPWHRLRVFDALGDPVPIAGGAGAWALVPGEPVVRYQLNGLGLREERELAPHAAPGVCRILVTGDAYPFGYGVRVRDAYPQRLERRLARHGRFEVVNGGFPNMDVEQQARRLVRLLPRLAPDVVLLGFSWWNVPLPAAAPGRPAKWSAAWLLANLEQKGVRLAGRSALAAHALTLLRGVGTPHWFAPSGLALEIEPLARTPEALGDRWRRAEAALRAMTRAATAAGARAAVVVTPLDLQVDPARAGLYRRGRLPYPAHGFVDADYARATAMPAALRDLAAAMGVPLVDLTPAFRAARARPLFLAHDYHAAPAGHRLIARAIGRWVLATRPCAPASSRHRR